MKYLLISVFCILSLFTLNINNTLAAPTISKKDDSNFVARVRSVKGKAYKLVGRTKVPLKVPQPVYPDEELNCEQNGRLILKFQDGSEVKITHLAHPYIVPHNIIDNGLYNSLRVTRGRARGNPNPIFSPAVERENDLSCVIPSNLTFKWTPFSPGTKISLSIRTEENSNDDLWSKNIVEDGKGKKVFRDLQDKLVRVRREKPDIELVFTLTADQNVSQSIHFNLITEENEKQLKLALMHNQSDFDKNKAENKSILNPIEQREADDENELFYHITNSSIYQKYKLYSEAADEMDKAITFAPDNIDIWKGDVWANQRTGNFNRVNYLLLHRPPGAENIKI